MAYLFTFGIASKFHTEFNTENVVQIGSWKNIWKQIVYRVAYMYLFDNLRWSVLISTSTLQMDNNFKGHKTGIVSP